MSTKVYAFVVNVSGKDWGRVINALSRGAAKAQYHRHLTDAWPDIPYTALRSRKVGAPVSSDRFISNAKYRGMPCVRCGDRVKVGVASGTIVGHNDSANFNVLFDKDSKKYAGLTLNCHPNDVVLEAEKGGSHD